MPSSGYAAWSVVADEQPTAAKWNILGTNDASFNTGLGFNDSIILDRHVAANNLLANKISNPYKFSVYQTSSPAVNNTVAKVPHNVELFDTNGDYNTALYRYVCPFAGFWLFNMQVQNGSAGMGTNEAALSYLYKNGAEIKRSLQLIGSGNASQIVRTSIVTIEQAAAADYFEHYAQVIGARDISGGSSTTYFQGYLVSKI